MFYIDIRIVSVHTKEMYANAVVTNPLNSGLSPGHKVVVHDRESIFLSDSVMPGCSGSAIRIDDRWDLTMLCCPDPEEVLV